jgi:hypothetical protein
MRGRFRKTCNAFGVGSAYKKLGEYHLERIDLLLRMHVRKAAIIPVQELGMTTTRLIDKEGLLVSPTRKSVMIVGQWGVSYQIND